MWGDKKEWTKEELVSQLKPMCMYTIFVSQFAIACFFPNCWKNICFSKVFSEDEPDANNEIEISVSVFLRIIFY